MTPSGSRVVATSGFSNVTVMSIEVFAPSRGMLLPDPLHDAVRVVCYAVEAQEGPFETKAQEHGVILWVSDEDARASEAAARFCIESSHVVVRVAASERELFEKLVEAVNEWDPDFLTGFEVQKASIGYLVDRAVQLDVRDFVYVRGDLLRQCPFADACSNVAAAAVGGGSYRST